MSEYTVSIPRYQRRSLENPSIPITAAQLSSLLNYGPTHSKVQINEHTALTFTAVFAAIRILAEAVGMLPTAVFQGDEDEGDLTRATSHPAYRLVRYESNPEMTAAVFKETLMGHIAGWGNGYARIITDGANRPRRLLPLLPDRTYPERFAGQLRYVSGTDRFAPEEIIHVPGLSFNGIRGYSPISLAREAIAMGKAHEIFGATFFGNGANMDAVIQHPKAITKEALANLRESINAHYANPGNAHRPMLLEEGMTYNRISIAPEDAQFIEGRKFQVTEVARIFRIPPHMLADLDKGTRGTVEQSGIEFLTYTLAPWLEKWEQELNRKLFPESTDFFIRFDVRRLLRTDSAARQAYYASGRQWGYLSANDIRRQEGDVAIEGGDTYLSPVNMVPADMVNKGLSYGAPVPAPKGGTKPPPEPEDDPIDVDDDGSRCAKAMTPVFADVIARMLRKELNAAGRDSFSEEKFYPEHRRHVLESLRPAARALGAMINPKGNPAALEPALVMESFRTGERVAATSVEETAIGRAGILIQLLVQTAKANP